MELVFRPGVQVIFDHMAALHGLRIAFFSPDGTELRVGQSRGNCGYCELLRDSLGLGGACRALDERRRLQAATSRSVVAYDCHGGMTEAILAVRVAGRLLGFVMIGQFRSRRTPPAALLAQARKTGVPASRLTTAYARTPYLSRARINSLLGLFQVLVEFIAEHRLISIEDRLAPLLARLRERPEERLALSQAAALAGCSTTTLSRLIRQKLGQSYQSLRIGLALEKADALLRTAPELRVSDVAYRLGFEDPLYFSRLYRRHKGIPPREARRVKAPSAPDNPAGAAPLQ